MVPMVVTVVLFELRGFFFFFFLVVDFVADCECGCDWFCGGWQWVDSKEEKEM